MIMMLVCSITNVKMCDKINTLLFDVSTKLFTITVVLSKHGIKYLLVPNIIL